ncbi:peptidylprolyl isomerase [Brumimicrobium salinarum]|uniref:peptidylprolyl isomerase n=1 Tax=Brumimicrobium salinarum TaxID=2058658 RepID=A0A2I0R6S7_9FLAO|nr:peptidylprolyl isomerase [Brumimicrobium salinarum]PKR82293.1 peptidylprolyl isomerase [Brumimicrobium salinarum]
MRIILTLITLLFFATSAFVQSQDLELEKGLYAKITTQKGEIILELFPEKAPLTVANFVGLAQGKLKIGDSIRYKEPYYDGLVFHRVIDNFMIQGGDPSGNGSGGPGYRFWDEADNGVNHQKGSLSMANAGPHTNGSQFFITHVATPHLNGKHTVFGQVLAGQSVVDEISQGDTMQQVEIIEKGLKYKWLYNPSKTFKKEYARLAVVVEQKRLAEEKRKAEEKVRRIEAKAKTENEYKEYFYDLVKKKAPNAVQTPSGLVYVLHEEGEGETAQKGDTVKLHYKGTFVTGGKFDSSYDRGQPFEFQYLINNLIPGFNEGVGLSKKGTKIDLYVPYFLAYGVSGRGRQIPPYSDLLFEIEVLNLGK